MLGEPDGCIELREPVFGWFRFFAGLVTLLTWLFPQKRVDASVPACAECERDFRRRKLQWAVGEWAWYLGVGSAAIYWYGDAIEPFGKLGIGVAVAVIVVPVALAELFSPPVVHLVPSKGSVRYEFRHGSYAEEFAERNGARVV
jgi:hypothetical protein